MRESPAAAERDRIPLTQRRAGPARLRLLVLSNGAVGHTQRWVDYFVDRGDEVHLASLESGVPTRAHEHRLPSLVPLSALKYPMTVPWVRKLVQRLKPDAVVGHFVPNYGFLASLVGVRPYAVVAWGSDVLLNATRTRFHHWRVRRTLEGADLVLSDASMLTDAIRALGVQPRRIETLTFGIDTLRFRPLETPRPEPPIVLSYRQLLPLYHVDLLVRAVPEIARHSSAPFQVRIIGQGRERERLRALAAQLGVSDRVTFVEGRLRDEELTEEIRRASIYVSTSRSDTTSVSLLEAMACGVAPVVTRIAGNEEWIRDGENGLLVPLEPPADLGKAIGRLLEAPSLRATFAERNLHLVRARADWARNMERTRRLLGDLIDR
jgi:glycosyltransferase involved in cell wall biosynthesis